MDLQAIPGIGKAMERDLNILGIYNVSALKNKNPENLYNQLCKLYGTKIDRCVLYVFRCAIYYSKTQNKDPELLKWWNWKNRTINNS